MYGKKHFNYPSSKCFLYIIWLKKKKNFYDIGLHAPLLQSCPTACNSMDHSPPGSSVHRIFQGSTLEWGGMPSSKGSSQPRDWTCFSYVSCTGRRDSLPLSYLLGKLYDIGLLDLFFISANWGTLHANHVNNCFNTIIVSK